MNFVALSRPSCRRRASLYPPSKDRFPIFLQETDRLEARYMSCAYCRRSRPGFWRANRRIGFVSRYRGSAPRGMDRFFVDLVRGHVIGDCGTRIPEDGIAGCLVSTTFDAASDDWTNEATWLSGNAGSAHKRSALCRSG